MSRAELLLEIGTEEIPAEFVNRALSAMKDLAAKALTAERIEYEEIATLGTPRRLVLHVKNVAKTQKDRIEERTGPPKEMAFDASGKPTAAAVGFARSQGVDVGDLKIIKNKNREVIGVIKEMKGRNTEEVLQEILPKFIFDIPFNKSMRWMDLDIRFARPIHWILALFDGVKVPFSVGNINSDQYTYGHRFMSDKNPIAVSDFELYLEETRKASVIVDHNERKDMIRKQVDDAAEEVGGLVHADENLLTEVTFMVEYPYVILGNFDGNFLDLPAEVLINSMKKHQKYFSVLDKDGNLKPNFIGVCNLKPNNDDLVRDGMGRVLRARLRDAQFFYEEDLKESLDVMAESLKGVVFQKKLGTSWEKMERFRSIALKLARRIVPEREDAVGRAALLCKADLESSMVFEFPELQGIIGRKYALAAGEPAEIADAILEHYLPAFAGDRLPKGDEGALVGIADRIDTIAGCFGVGLIPSGTADPYALRRHTIAIINIIMEKGYDLPLDLLVDLAVEALASKITRDAAEVRQDVLDFFLQRYINLMSGRGFAPDVVDAVVTVGYMNLISTLARINALQELKGEEDFQPLAIAFKRIVNIIKEPIEGDVDPKIFQEEAERGLYEKFKALEGQIAGLLEKEDFFAALSAIASLKDAVDKFFDEVLVMAEDVALRQNRLRLLRDIRQMFFRFADFSRLATE